MKIDRLLMMPLMSSTILFATTVLSQNHAGISNTNKNLAGTRQYASFSINNLTSWLRADGLSSRSPSGNHGSIFPRGTADVIYQDGIMWGGKAYVDAAKTKAAPFGQTIRVGGANYYTGCRAGRINGFGANAVATDSNAADARVYRIRRDYFTMSTEELLRDAAEANEISVANVTDAQMQAIREQYTEDWQEWPVQYGAPFIDRNRNNRYDPPPPFNQNFTAANLITGQYDEPGIAGTDSNFPADQVIWTVCNDLDRNQTLYMTGSEPLGLEAQVTLWGYKHLFDAGDFFFRRIRLINKGGVAIDNVGAKGAFFIDSMYVAQWVDPDLGYFADDLIGCDTLRSMGYVYNSTTLDPNFISFKLPPPAVGFDIVQGPRVPAPGASAIFDLQHLAGWKNLKMTSFWPKFSGAAVSDPARGSYQQGTLKYYKLLRGFVPDEPQRPDRYYTFPPGVTPNPFPFSGDPVTGTGFIDGMAMSSYSVPPGERRMAISSGPFRLAPGDTQEVVVAVVAGLGADRLSSITAMRFVDGRAQALYNALLTGVEVRNEKKEEIPNYFKLFASYPNPLRLAATNSFATIRYQLPVQSPVTLTIFNLLGEEVARLVEQIQPAGEYAVRWDGKSASGQAVAAGVYFYQIETGRFNRVKKLLVIR